MAEEDQNTTQSPFQLMDGNDDNDAVLDDFFDTAHSNTNAHQQSSSSARNYDLSSERFLFDGDDEDVIVVPASPTTPYLAVNTEPLLPNYLLHGCSNNNNNNQQQQYQAYDPDDGDQWSADHPLALPMARLTQQEHYARRRSYPELSGLNYLNLCTLLVHLTISILFGSGVVEGAMKQKGDSWLPSTWTVTTRPEYETLLTPSQWAGDYLWIPVIALEGIFVLVQLLPKVRSRTEVVTAVGYSWFYVGILQSLTTLFFCLEWIIPAWFALAGTVVCLLWMLYYHQHRLLLLSEQSTMASPKSWEYWVFRFPFDLHLGWSLPLLASRGSMIFRYFCGNFNIGLQLAADIVAMALLLSCAGAHLVRGSSAGPRSWVVPLVILWAFLGIAWRLAQHPPDVLVEAYGSNIVEAVRDAAWCFTGAVGLLVVPRIVIWVAREFMTIHVLQLAADDEDPDDDLEDLLLPQPHSGESGMTGMTDF